MFRSRFPGGVKPPGDATAPTRASQVLPRPAQVVLPLKQHAGAACSPLVKAGDRVGKGQPVGDVNAPVAAPVHASVSGRVTAVEPRLTPSGRQEISVVIEADPEDRWWDGLPEPLGWNLIPEELEPDAIRERTLRSGIVGMGGAGFPTAAKLSPKSGRPRPEVVLLNGSECEPYLSADHRLMLEEPGRIALGLRLIMQAVGASQGIIALEDNKADAAEALRPWIKSDPRLRIELLPSRYPQGAEKMLVWAVLRRKVPLGGLPLDVGVVVQNVATACAVAVASAEGRPAMERMVTVAGQVANPGNWRVPLGTPIGEVINASGGLREPVARMIVGGPMMGIAQSTLDVPVIKTTNGLVLLAPQPWENREPDPCIRCGRCVAACPMGLVPAQLNRMAESGRLEEARRFNIAACIECGSCSYVCPARRPLTPSIRAAKAELASLSPSPTPVPTAPAAAAGSRLGG